MIRALSIGLLCLLASCSPQQDVADPPTQLAHEIEAQVGGKDALDGVRYLRFDFEVTVNDNVVYVARHLWDRTTGRYREEWELFGEGAQAVFNVNSEGGRAFRNGQEVGSDEQAEILEQARYNYLNDNYWLLLPWKLTDPGVMLSRLKHTLDDGVEYDVLHLKFEDGVGESSGDEHWVFVNPESGQIERTAYFLERFEKDEPSLEEATVWSWGNWVDVNGATFAKTRKVLRTVHDPFESASSEITLLAILDDVDDAVFLSPSVPMPNTQ